MTWSTYSGWAGRALVNVTTTSTLVASPYVEYVVLLKSGALPTLPTAVSNTSLYRIKNVTASPITLATTSSQTIDGSKSIIVRPNVVVDLVSDGSNWFVF